MALSRTSPQAIFAAFVLLAACGGSGNKPPAGTRPSCGGDADCVLTTGSGCCVVCPGEPTAIPSLSFEQQKNRCAEVECKAASERVECPKVESPSAFAARCVAGTCHAVRR